VPVDAFLALVLGAFGGLLNSLLVDAGFRLPSRDRDNPDVWKAGFLGNVLLGVGAALATYLIGTSDLDRTRALGIAFISGIGGGSVLTALVQRYSSAILQAKVESLERTVQVLANAAGASRREDDDGWRSWS
jgi:uncharacterized membrane protein YeaQ/YmgE (transglycosylase-associated protein family)